MRSILTICITSMLFLGSAGALAQEPAEPLAEKRAEKSVEAGRRTGITEAGNSAPVMSPAENTQATLASASELVTQSGNTMMTPGVCLVIDALVMEFCNANPDDISCQFR